MSSPTKKYVIGEPPSYCCGQHLHRATADPPVNGHNQRSRVHRTVPNALPSQCAAAAAAVAATVTAAPPHPLILPRPTPHPPHLSLQL